MMTLIEFLAVGGIVFSLLSYVADVERASTRGKHSRSARTHQSQHQETRQTASRSKR